jgi:hypothetical protein
VGLDGVASLIVASLDLELVRLIRGAIRVADLSSGKGVPASGLGPAPNPEPRRHLNPEPVIEPRRHFHPEPTYEPRRVLQSSPRIEIKPPQVVYAIQPAEPSEIPAPCHSRSPIKPPWRVLPWNQPLPPRPVFKIVVKRPDITHIGRSLNLFA